MTNSYYNRAYNPLPSTKIRAKDLKDEATRVEQGFDKLPSPGALAGGQGNYTLDTGSANAIVIAVSSQLTSLTDGVSFRVRIAATNTGATTLTPGALGSPAVVRVDGTALQAGDVIAGQIADFTYSSAMSKFQLLVSSSQTDADTATQQAGIATTQAGIATTQAGISTASAATSTAQAAISTAQAVIATAQAVIATTQAGLATTNGAAQVALATTQAGLAASSAAAAAAAAASIGYTDVVFLTSASSPYTVSQATAGKLLSVDTSGGAVTVNMPTIAGLVLPFVVGVKKATSDTNAITINRGGTDTFDGAGATSKTISVESGLTLIPDTDTAPDRWTTIAFGGANAGPLTSSGLTIGTGKVAGRQTAGTGAIEELALTLFALLGTAGVFTASQAFSDMQVSRAMLIDCGMTAAAKGNSGTATQTYDYTAGSVQSSTATGNHTIATSNWPPTGNFGAMLIMLTNGGAFTVTWPTVNWVKPDGTTTTSIATYLAANTGRTALQSAGLDQVLLWSTDGGTTIYGKLV